MVDQHTTRYICSLKSLHTKTRKLVCTALKITHRAHTAPPRQARLVVDMRNLWEIKYQQVSVSLPSMFVSMGTWLGGTAGNFTCLSFLASHKDNVSSKAQSCCTRKNECL